MLLTMDYLFTCLERQILLKFQRTPKQYFLLISHPDLEPNSHYIYEAHFPCLDFGPRTPFIYSIDLIWAKV